ncbi:unnamed protein product [Paramecium octaurelia]|uniref:LITAF domain-containing protein n=1 Tax=Paramecium octaurelia TaxID=43137 RepID=A0A8S1XR89_PAROT|nr:unnamed protein product [Paramecium octaurelia]CAD8203086.1 unnamed protein product [Paramecium octaurelia]
MSNNNKHFPLPQTFDQENIPTIPKVQYPSFELQDQNQLTYNQYAQPIQQGYPIQYSPTFQNSQISIQSNSSVVVSCYYCQKQVQTIVSYEAGAGAYLVGGVLAALGLWLGCCLIPCYLKDCQDAVHFCSQCSAQLGRKKFIF